MNRITIGIGAISIDAVLDDKGVARLLYERLPLELELSRWGDELYGSCGLAATAAMEAAKGEAREIMEVGELAYWPDGDAFCIFFGPTPSSTDDRPRAVSPVIPLGRCEGDLQELKHLPPEVRASVRTA